MATKAWMFDAIEGLTEDNCPSFMPMQPGTFPFRELLVETRLAILRTLLGDVRPDESRIGYEFRKLARLHLLLANKATYSELAPTLYNTCCVRSYAFDPFPGELSTDFIPKATGLCLQNIRYLEIARGVAPSLLRTAIYSRHDRPGERRRQDPEPADPSKVTDWMPIVAGALPALQHIILVDILNCTVEEDYFPLMKDDIPTSRDSWLRWLDKDTVGYVGLTFSQLQASFPHMVTVPRFKIDWKEDNGRRGHVWSDQELPDGIGSLVWFQIPYLIFHTALDEGQIAKYVWDDEHGDDKEGWDPVHPESYVHGKRQEQRLVDFYPSYSKPHVGIT